MDEQNELQPDSKEHGRNLDGTFAPGHKFSVGNSGRPPGLGFKALLRMTANEIAAGDKTWRQLLIDKAFRRAIKDDSDKVLISLMQQLDDEPKNLNVNMTNNVQVPRRVTDCNIDEILGADNHENDANRYTGGDAGTNGNGKH